MIQGQSKGELHRPWKLDGCMRQRSQHLIISNFIFNSWQSLFSLYNQNSLLCIVSNSFEMFNHYFRYRETLIVIATGFRGGSEDANVKRSLSGVTSVELQGCVR